jgi:3-hydroxyacyl-[acyl-carrier-protein] dehydratase
MTSLALPLDYAAIERILAAPVPVSAGRPRHRMRARQADRRVKNVSLNERYLWHGRNEEPVLPATILTEAIAQVGAILILSKPENKEKLIFFMGIERVRYRRQVHPGDVVEIEAVVKRLRSRMGVLSGAARVDGKVVCHGTMTFRARAEVRGQPDL